MSRNQAENHKRRKEQLSEQVSVPLVLRFTADTSRSTAGNLLNEGDIGIVRGSKFPETLPPEKIERILSVEFYPT
jgi:hypothetical protein